MDHLTVIRKPYVDYSFPRTTSIVVKLEKWNDIVDLNQQFLSQFIFRGQSDEKWSLSTSLERFVSGCHYDAPLIQKTLIYEAEMLKDFRVKYPLFKHAADINIDSPVECLTLMQHYGCPTRLLDFTHSIFVALFMALDGNYKCDSVIWAIKKFSIKLPHINKLLHSKDVFSAPTSDIIKEINNSANKHIGVEYVSNSPSEILPIFPTWLNERSSIQQGCFLMPTSIQKPFIDVFNEYFKIEDSEIILDIENLKARCQNNVFKQDAKNLTMIKFIIPSKLKWELSQLLRQMNIT
ncbi:MAG: hypothetical protein C7K11_05670, partial [Candidatus Amulumruptor caecigallinarius]